MIAIIGDPGHGGEDRHNLGFSKEYVEADGTLVIGLAFADALNEYEDVSCTLTRYTDKTMSLTTRGRLAANGFMFVSQHTNASNDPNVRGVEVFYSVDHPEDAEVAALISAAIALAFDIPDRGAKVRPGTNDPTEDYYTIIDTAEDVGCKHVFLVEAMFHSNPESEQLLLDEENLKRIGRIQAEVFAGYYGFKKTSQVSDWAKDAQEWVVKNEISDGKRSKDLTTREEVWTMMHDMHKVQAVELIEAVLEATKQILLNGGK